MRGVRMFSRKMVDRGLRDLQPRIDIYHRKGGKISETIKRVKHAKKPLEQWIVFTPQHPTGVKCRTRRGIIRLLKERE